MLLPIHQRLYSGVGLSRAIQRLCYLFFKRGRVVSIRECAWGAGQGVDRSLGWADEVGLDRWPVERKTGLWAIKRVQPLRKAMAKARSKGPHKPGPIYKPRFAPNSKSPVIPPTVGLVPGLTEMSMEV